MFDFGVICLKVVDCRVCGDPHSHLRFAFVEFADECKLPFLISCILKFVLIMLLNFMRLNCFAKFSCYLQLLAVSARAALSLGGTQLGFSPVKVLPSKTAILPVNPTFLPKV